ncbi:hypothetical protein [Testudinibacter aquarius]|uniref:Uncharacterized protein n=1 Tax=Testudinibacter aquarius TaxID=1524974 RepID=A0A4R3Y888_9PAST|nr:hypothetical protein [Testudinibacter aquarius]KAE9528056.1 hypothetical protein A1D24_01455 [Testudinibacter aquarius]TCV86513.1 hypothetical protein EDC16_10667 [Testudinibacter aquarius]TNG92640.1 hypothetical protein FHQ21_03845 [Testudinibacter aquarius]
MRNSKPTPNAIFKSVMAKTAEGNLITEDGENLLKLYRNELTEAYHLPKDFSEVRHIEAQKGEQIGLIASLAVNFVNYHILAKALCEIPDIKQLIDQTLGEAYLANATEWTGGNLNHISQIINVDNLGADWREQAKASHQKMIEESAPLPHRTIVMTGEEVQHD